MLTLENISFDVKGEGGEKEIIKNLSLTIDEGKFVVITGPNGGGKSTMAKLIAGIYKPTSGRILFNGTDITEAGITERANMGIMFFLGGVGGVGDYFLHLFAAADHGNTAEMNCPHKIAAVLASEKAYVVCHSISPLYVSPDLCREYRVDFTSFSIP